MKAELIRIPEKVIENIRNILDRPIMRGQGVEEQKVTERFRNQNRALNKRIVVRQILIIPNPLALQSGRMNQNRNGDENNAAKPIRVSQPRDCS